MKFKGKKVDAVTSVWNYSKDGKDYEITLEIDERWLTQQLGRRAVENKGKRCTAVAGAIVVIAKPK